MIAGLLTRARPPRIQPVPWRAGFTSWPFGTDVDPAYFTTKEDALGLSVVSGFLSIVCSLVLQMTLRAYAGDVEVPAPPILRNPAPGGNRVRGDWLCEMTHDLVLYGNFVAILGPLGANGWPTLFYPIPYGQWTVQPDGTYQVAGITYQSDEVFHVRRNCCTGQLDGVGFLEQNKLLVATCVANERWSQLFFEGGAVPPVWVKHPSPDLTQAQAEVLQLAFTRATRRRQPVVTPAGTDITVLPSDAEKAQMNESRKWNSQQLAAALGIPGALLGLDSPSLVYRNLVDVFQQFISTTILSYLVPVEEQLTEQCLPRGTSARFDTSMVLRPDLAERVSIAVSGLAGGVYTPDEARDLVGLAPLPDGAAVAPETPAQLALVEGGTP